jgi:hypothetical protein
MKYLILGTAIGSIKNYRGVDRPCPHYIDNELFYWSTEVHEKGYLEDFEKRKP